VSFIAASEFKKGEGASGRSEEMEAGRRLADHVRELIKSSAIAGDVEVYVPK
jgi:hypothetical protein